MRWKQCGSKAAGTGEVVFRAMKDAAESRQVRHRSANPARDTCRRPWRCWSGAAGRLGKICSARCGARATDGAVVEFETVAGGRQPVVTEGSELTQKVLTTLKIRTNPPSRTQSEASETTKSGHAVKIRK